MKIAIFEIEEWEKDFLAEALAQHDLVFFDHPLSEKTSDEAADADIVSVFVYSSVDASTLDKLSEVKLICTRSMGYNHIDVDACRKRGVVVSRVPAYGERTVAEHAFALILALSRKIFLAYERTEKHEFDYRGLQGFDLYGKTIGIIGGGKIGLTVARIAKGFEMNILVADPHENEESSKEIGFSYAPIEELLKQSDVITLHAPLLPATEHMINEESIQLIKPGAILVNTARGGLIDTKALLKALEEGILSGAGLDVLEEECTLKEESELMSKEFPKKCDLGALVRNHMLIKRDDVIITPHIAFNSKEAVSRILSTTAENIDRFVNGSPENQV